MASINKVILVGNLGQDPEIKYMPSGGAVTNISIATTDSWKDKATGEKKENTEWHRVVFFNRLAEIVGEYLRKGSQIYVEGNLRTRKWQDQNGQDKYTTENVAREMQMLGSNAGGSIVSPNKNPQINEPENVIKKPSDSDPFADFDDPVKFDEGIPF